MRGDDTEDEGGRSDWVEVSRRTLEMEEFGEG